MIDNSITQLSVPREDPEMIINNVKQDFGTSLIWREMRIRKSSIMDGEQAKDDQASTAYEH